VVQEKMTSFVYSAYCSRLGMALLSILACPCTRLLVVQEKKTSVVY
jgi:hypothetical protein